MGVHVILKRDETAAGKGHRALRSSDELQSARVLPGMKSEIRSNFATENS